MHYSYRMRNCLPLGTIAWGRMEKPESGIWKRNPEPESGTGTGQINEWFKFWKYDWHQYAFSLLSAFLARWMMIYGALLKIMCEYKEHSSCHSFQLNDILNIQSIFAFVFKSRQRRIYMGNTESGRGDCMSSDWVYGDCN